MMVDATYLLNLRHVHGRDEAWLAELPEEGDELAFDAVLERRDDSDAVRRVACVTWGTGVVRRCERGSYSKTMLRWMSSSSRA